MDKVMLELVLPWLGELLDFDPSDTEHYITEPKRKMYSDIMRHIVLFTRSPRVLWKCLENLDDNDDDEGDFSDDDEDEEYESDDE
jgi:hypothetical protein